MNYAVVLDAVCAWARSHGIDVQRRPLRRDQAGIFDGISFTLNEQYTAEELVYYFVHALGSVVRWSLSHDHVQAMFDELRDAKKDRADAKRLTRAIETYRAFEIESSEFAIEILSAVGCANAIASYTNFMRADLEALTEFHRTGRAPIWKEFFAHWNEEVAAGQRTVPSFARKPIPAFTPRPIEKQEILQKQA